MLLRKFFLLVAVLPPAWSAAAQNASTQPSAGLTTAPSSEPPRDETLWREIVTLDRTEPRFERFEDRFEAQLANKRHLLEKTRLYLALYPGGERRADAIRLELRTLFEIGCLSAGDYAELQSRLEEYLSEGVPDQTRWEAAYWSMICRRLSRESERLAPTSAPAGPDEADASAFHEYITRFPDSPYTPRLAAILFDAAKNRSDTARMHDLLSLLERHDPQHATTALLRAELRRIEAVGRPFHLTFETTDGRRIDSSEYAGALVLVVVWSSRGAASLERIREIESFRRTHPLTRVIGVNVDPTREEMLCTCTQLKIDWPQYRDDLGWAHRFIREWGIRDVPHVFVIAPDGTLAGATPEPSWRDLALRAGKK